MKIIPFVAALSFFGLFAVGGCADVAGGHKEHHPDTMMSTQKVNPNTTPAMNHETMNDKAMNAMAIEKMDNQMKVMRDIHEKMMRATSTEARKKLMAEHMKAMQSGMNMMNDMPMMANHSDENTSHEHTGMMGDMKGNMNDGMKGGMKDGLNSDMKDTMKCDMKGEMKSCCMKDSMKCDMDAGMAAKHQMMEKRMQMMETMIQMMMDRMMNDDYDEHQTSAKK
jgi:hypothetical protein